jgi:crotonobetainyl-CoA:carnitine CoA-transferase CaiB-like acyl-CoA transferase
MNASSQAPLAGLRILDLTRLLPGPAATMHLADFGADVIKIEDTDAGDYLRGFPPQLADADGARVNAIFEAVNRGKRSIRIDLKSEAGRSVFFKLLDSADALIEGFRPGVMARLGLGWDVLHARKPSLVVCSLSGYGQSGPLAQVAGHDINYLATSGVLDQIRAQGRCAIPNLQIGDLLGGALSALAMLLVALLAAQRSGVGRYVDVAMTDGLLAHHFFAHAEHDAGSTPAAEGSLLTGGAPCYRVYETADGAELAVGALEPKFWDAFCDAIDLPELKPNHWSRGERPGSEAAGRTAQRVAARLRERPLPHWLSIFARVDACVAPVLKPAEALAHPQFVARERVHRRGAITHVGPLAQMTEHAFAVRPAPAPGAHTRELLRELGFDDRAIAALVASGAVRVS